MDIVAHAGPIGGVVVAAKDAQMVAAADGNLGGGVLSPDGSRVAFMVMMGATGTYDIWIYDLARDLRTRFTFDDGLDWWPAWSPDGERIIYTRGGVDKVNDRRYSQIWIMNRVRTSNSQRSQEARSRRVA